MPAEATQVFRLIYASRDRMAPTDRRAELGELFTLARRNNKELGVTGALLLGPQTFVQTLEGEETVVRELFSRICGDPRHDGVTLLDARSVGDRVFSRWAMAQVAEQGESDIALLAHADGIAPAVARTPTGEQELVLDLMRGAARREPAAS